MLSPEEVLNRRRITDPWLASRSRSPLRVVTRRLPAGRQVPTMSPLRASMAMLPVPVARTSASMAMASPAVRTRSPVPLDWIAFVMRRSSPAVAMKSPSLVLTEASKTTSPSASSVRSPLPVQFSARRKTMSPSELPGLPGVVPSASVVMTTLPPALSAWRSELVFTVQMPGPSGGLLTPGETAAPPLSISTLRGSSSQVPPAPVETAAIGPMASANLPEVSTSPPPAPPSAAMRPSKIVVPSAQATTEPPLPLPPVAVIMAPSAIVTWSARALDTPAATVPTPISDTSFTETSPAGLTFFRS